MTDYALGSTIYIPFTTRAFGTGVPTTLGGTPALSVLEENNATPITSGVSVSVDRASVTGLNEATIVASSGNGFESGKSYGLYISTGTVGGVSVVGEVIAHFTIEKASALRPVTAGRTLVVDAAGLADANVVKVGPTGSGTAQTARDIGASVLLSAGTGTGQLDFTSGVVKSNMVQIIATALTETVGGYLAAGFKKLFDVAVPVFTAASVNQTGDSYARLGAPAGASHAADVASVKTDTGTTIPAMLTTIDDFLDTEMAQVLGDTTTDIPAQISALNNLSAAQVNAEVVDALNVDTYAEPGQGNPAATLSLVAKVNYLYAWVRNRKTNDGTTTKMYADDGTTVNWKQSTSESGGTVEKAEIVSGP